MRILESHNFLPHFVNIVRYFLMAVDSSATSTLFFLRAMYAAKVDFLLSDIKWHEYARLAIFVTRAISLIILKKTKTVFAYCYIRYITRTKLVFYIQKGAVST